MLDLESAVGRTLDIDNSYFLWGWSDTSRAQWDIASGRAPMLSWKVQKANGGCATPAEILSGVYDAQLASQAQSIAALGGPAYLRFFYEFNVAGAQQVQCFFANSGDHAADFVAVW